MTLTSDSPAQLDCPLCAGDGLDPDAWWRKCPRCLGRGALRSIIPPAQTLSLPGCDPTNPLGYLAGVGVIFALRCRARWECSTASMVLHVETDLPLSAIAQRIADQDAWPIATDTPYDCATGGRNKLAVIIENIRALAGPREIARDLAARWTYPDLGRGANLRLDPGGVNPPYALAATDPAKMPHPVNLGAQRCALLAIAELGCDLWFGGELRWPIWERWAGASWVRRLLRGGPGLWRCAGVALAGVSRRIQAGYYRRLSPSLYTTISEQDIRAARLARQMQGNYAWHQRRREKIAKRRSAGKRGKKAKGSARKIVRRAKEARRLQHPAGLKPKRKPYTKTK